MLMGFSKSDKWPKSVQGWQRYKPNVSYRIAHESCHADAMFCTVTGKRQTEMTAANVFAVTSPCLDRFCSFFRFYKSQYYFLNAIFYTFFCFDTPKMGCEHFYARELEEMCSKWYLTGKSTDLKSAAPVCKSIC